MKEAYGSETFGTSPFAETERELEMRRAAYGYRMPAQRRPPPRSYRRPPRFPLNVRQLGRFWPAGTLATAANPPDCSEQVRWTQDSLNHLLGLNLVVDGSMTAVTRNAVRRFQQQQGLRVTGIVGPDTLNSLMAATREQPTPGADSNPPADPNTSDQSASEAFEFFPRSQFPELAHEGGPIEVGLGVAALGLAVYSAAREVLTSGDLSVQADTANYVHQNTPVSIPFTRRVVEFKITAFHPRIGIDTQEFFFRLSFEYNRYDLRGVSISVLRDKSSSLYASTFQITFNASSYSLPNDSVASIAYNVTNGRWDPVGRGDVSFSATPLFIIKADGHVQANPINSEEDWVKFAGFDMGTLRDTPLPRPSAPGMTPRPISSGTILRMGSRGQAVVDLQIRLNRWLASQGRSPLEVDSIFGSKVRAAVLAFQRATGVTADGIVGPVTLRQLANY